MDRSKLLSMNSIWVELKFVSGGFQRERTRYKVVLEIKDVYTRSAFDFQSDLEDLITENSSKFGTQGPAELSVTGMCEFIASKFFANDIHVLHVSIRDTLRKVGASVYFLEDKKVGEAT